MAGPVKTVCFIASTIIAWGLFVIGEAIVAWFDYKINGTKIPWNLEFILPTEGFLPLSFPHRIIHMNNIVILGLLLHGIRKETTRTMLPWMSLYYIYMFTVLFVILILEPILFCISSYPSGPIGMKLIVNCFSPDQFEISKAEYKWICFFLTFYIYGTWVEEIFKSIKGKEDAKDKKELDKKIAKINKSVANIAKIEEGKKTKEGEKNTISEKDPGKVV